MEKAYCMPNGSIQTATAAFTAYLRRFISLKMRVSISLTGVAGSGSRKKSLINHYSNVLEFFYSLLVEAFTMRGNFLSKTEAHEAVRVVWGRSKNALKRANEKKKNKEQLRIN